MPAARTWIAATANETRATELKLLRKADVMLVPPRQHLLVGLQISDDIIRLRRIGDAAERHPVALHLGLWIDQVGTQIGRVPDDVRALHRVGIAEIIERRRLAAEHALEIRPDRVRLLRVARRAGEKELFAVGSVG